MFCRWLCYSALCLAGCTSTLDESLSREGADDAVGDDDTAPSDDDAVADDDAVPDDDLGDDDAMPDDDLGDDDLGDDDPGDDDLGDDDLGDDDLEPGAGPALVETMPVNGAVDVGPNTKLELTFDRAVFPGVGALAVLDAVNDSVIEDTPFVDPRVTIVERTVTVDLTTQLALNTTYYVLVAPSALKDENDEPFDGITEPTAFSFTTRAPEALVLVSTLPETGATGVSVATDIVLTFDQDVQAGGAGELSVFERASATLVQSVELSDTAHVTFDGPTVTVDLPASLELETEYTVALAEGTVRSVQGASFAGFSDPETLAFTTEPPPPLVLQSTVPADDALDVDPAASLVLTFSEPIVAGEGAIGVYSADGAPFEVIPITSSSVSISGVSVTVDLAGTLRPSTDYYVLVDAGAVASQLGAAFGGIADDTAFSFRTAEAVLPPLVLVETSPLDDATEVPVDVLISLVFDREVQAGMGSITLFDAATDTIVHSLDVTNSQVSIDGATVTVDFGVLLEGNRDYYVTIGAGSFTSVDGAAFAGIADADGFSFTTEEAFGLVGTTPAAGASLVDPATDLSLVFNEDVAVGSGNLVVSTSDGSVLEAIPIGDPRVSMTGDTVVVDLDALLAGDTEYTVVLDAGAVVSADGGEFSGLAAGSWTFETAPVAPPGDVSGSLALWLDASHAASIKDEAGVRYWADRSPQHNDLSQADSALRPVLVAAALGGAPAVRFDGTDDHLPALGNLPFSAFEGFVVWQSAVAPGNAKRTILINGRNFEVNHGHAGAGARNALSVCVGDACVNNAGWHNTRFTPDPLAAVPYLWDFGFDAVPTSTFARSQGGAPVFNSAPTASPTAPTGTFSVGGHPVTCVNDNGGCHFAGDVAEVLLYSRVLGREERLAVTAALRSKWSVAAPVCDADEVLGPSGSCYFVGGTPVDYAAARSACQARGRGWDLASVRSQEDHDFVVGQLSADTWIGASDAALEGSWQWVGDTLQFWSGNATGTAVNDGFNRWLSGEPTGGTDEHCARYSFGTDWFWHDGLCTQTFVPLCEGPGN